MRNKAARLPLAIGLAALIATEALSHAAEKQPDPFIEIAEGVYVLSQPDPVAKFRMTTQTNRPFDNSNLNGKWSFLFFGFTHCPDLCPATLAAFTEIQRRLTQRAKDAADVQFILVSVDPERDIPERLKKFLAPFNPDFIGLTGDAVNLARLSDSVGAVYAKAPGSSPENYLMDHSSAVLLINPEGRLHAIFAAPHAPAIMAQAFIQIRGSAKPST